MQTFIRPSFQRAFCNLFDIVMCGADTLLSRVLNANAVTIPQGFSEAGLIHCTQWNRTISWLLPGTWHCLLRSCTAWGSTSLLQPRGSRGFSMNYLKSEAFVY